MGQKQSNKKPTPLESVNIKEVKKETLKKEIQSYYNLFLMDEITAKDMVVKTG